MTARRTARAAVGGWEIPWPATSTHGNTAACNGCWTMIDTLGKWQEWAFDQRESYFADYPLRGMMRLHDGRYQFGYEIAGYGTVVGYCCHHSHKTRESAEDCGARFLAGKPPNWWWRLPRLMQYGGKTRVT